MVSSNEPSRHPGIPGRAGSGGSGESRQSQTALPQVSGPLAAIIGGQEPPRTLSADRQLRAAVINTSPRRNTLPPRLRRASAAFSLEPSQRPDIPLASQSHSTPNSSSSSYPFPDMVRQKPKRRGSQPHQDDKYYNSKSDDADTQATNNQSGDNGGIIINSAVAQRPTLYELLRPIVPTIAQVDEEFQAFQIMTGWFLGCKDDTLGTYAFWKPAARNLQFSLARLLHIPTVDTHLAVISPSLRRSIVLVASMQYRCFFCAAHAASLGELAKGSLRAQVAARMIKTARSGTTYTGKPVTDPGDPRNSEKEAALLRLVTAASRIPSKVTPALKLAAAKGFGEDGLQMAAEMISLFGWTNAITDSIGMELETNFASFAEQQIGPAGWEAGRHAPLSSNETNSFLNFDSRDAELQEVRPRNGIRRIGDYTSLLRQVRIAEKQSSGWASSIPNSNSEIERWLVKHLGFAPAYIVVLRNLQAKRAICFMMWLFLIRNAEPDPCVEDAPCELSSGTKALLFYVYSTLTSNQLLRGHAIHIALRTNVPLTVLHRAANGETFNNQRLDAALAFVRRTAAMQRVHTSQDNASLLTALESPRGVMELACSVGLFNALHRLSAMCAPEPVAFEGPVKETLQVVGPYLKIDVEHAGPCATDSVDDGDPMQFMFV